MYRKAKRLIQIFFIFSFEGFFVGLFDPKAFKAVREKWPAGSPFTLYSTSRELKVTVEDKRGFLWVPPSFPKTNKTLFFFRRCNLSTDAELKDTVFTDKFISCTKNKLYLFIFTSSGSRNFKTSCLWESAYSFTPK